MAIKTFLTNIEIQEMIAKAEFPRDRVILTFLADVGCRVSELLDITVENIDLDRREVLIPHLKRGIKKKCPGCGGTAGRSQQFCSHCGGNLSKVTAEGINERSRLVNIGEATAQLLSEYIESEKLKPEDKLIDLSRQQIYNVVRDSAVNIGIKGKAILNPETGKRHYVHPHTFRDSLATEWLSLALDDISMQKALQAHLGHMSFATTMRYHKLTPVTVKNVSDKIRQLRFGGKNG